MIHASTWLPSSRDQTLFSFFSLFFFIGHLFTALSFHICSIPQAVIFRLENALISVHRGTWYGFKCRILFGRSIINNVIHSDKSRSRFSGNNKKFFSRDYLWNVSCCKLKIAQSCCDNLRDKKRKTFREGEKSALNECTLPSFTREMTIQFPEVIIDNSVTSHIYFLV